MWQTRIHNKNLSDMCGKRESEPVERVPATPNPNTKTRNTDGNMTYIHIYLRMR